MTRTGILVVGAGAWLRVGYLLREGVLWLTLAVMACAALWSVWALARRVWESRP